MTCCKASASFCAKARSAETPRRSQGRAPELDDLLAEDLQKGIRLVISITPDFPVIRADGIQLQQAIHNLIVNSAEAILAVARAGAIKVYVTLPSYDEVEIEYRTTALVSARLRCQ